MGQKRVNSLVQYWKWYVNDVVCSANGHVYSERLRPFRPNGCVSSGTTRSGQIDVYVRLTDVSVRNGSARSN